MDRWLAAIIESSDDAIISKDLNGIVTSWNRAAERIFGYSAEEMIGRPIALLAAPDVANEMPEILKKVRRGERVEHYETVRMSKEGKPIPVSLTVSPVRDAAGEIVGASKIARDVTEAKRIARTLSMRERELQTLLANLPDIIARFDSHLELTYVSPAIEAVAGVSAEAFLEAVRAGIGNAGEMVESLRRSAAKVLKTGRRDQVEFGYSSPAQGERSLSALTIPERSRDGEGVSTLSIVRDVTDQKQAEEAQRAVERELMLLVGASGSLLAAPHSSEVQQTII
jgi:PAS domain S-box-containing protein